MHPLDKPCFLNIHSCEKQWLQFLNTPSNELTEHKDEIMGFLRNMADAYSEDSLAVTASALEESNIWHNSVKLRTWFQAEWLPIAKVFFFILLYVKIYTFFNNFCSIWVLFFKTFPFMFVFIVLSTLQNS